MKFITKDELKYKVVYKSDQSGWFTTSFFSECDKAVDYYVEKAEENKEPVLYEIKTTVTETALMKAF